MNAHHPHSGASAVRAAASALTVLALSRSLHAQTAAPFRLLESPALANAADPRGRIPEARPPARGFIAPLFERAADPIIFELPPPADARLSAAASLVAQRLAFDGLLQSTLVAIDDLRAGGATGDTDELLDQLRQIGLPLDLLHHFIDPAGKRVASRQFVSSIVEGLQSGRPIDELRRDLAGYSFNFEPSRSGFAASTESGEHRAGMVRLQLTRGEYWDGPGAGGNLDVARQLLGALPDIPFLASIQHVHLAELSRTAAGWPIGLPDRLTVIAEPWVISQWTQDNGKAGTLTDDGDGSTRWATIIPRYASRREDGSVFVPGESLLMEGVAASGHSVIHSSLLFQGGNLLIVRDAASRERLMLLGEAELYRNIALGLSREQVLGAFAAEFAVDRCVVLPAAAFHVDYDVSVRSGPNGNIAFVNDPRSAARTILACGVDALAKAGSISREHADAARRALKDDDAGGFLAHAGPVLSGVVLPGNRFPESFASRFSTGAGDSGVGNLRCFLVALDTFVAGRIQPNSPVAAAYLATFQRRDADREKVSAILKSLGWRVVPVPSMPDELRGINYLNGLHEPDRYLMPAWGGLYRPLDDSAAAVFQRELGPETRIEPIYCAESQRRAGALHCSVAIYPRIEAHP